MTSIASTDELTRDRLEAIRRDTAELVRATPVLTSRSLSERCGGVIALKAENLQRTGSFKLRGALSKVRALGGEHRRRGGGQRRQPRPGAGLRGPRPRPPVRGLRARRRAAGQGRGGELVRRHGPPRRRRRRRLPGQRPGGCRRGRPDVREPVRRLRRDRRPGRRGAGAGRGRARPGARDRPGRRRRAGRRRGGGHRRGAPRSR